MDKRRELIRRIFLGNGYTIKPGQDDLKPYVYEAAEELIQAFSNLAAQSKGAEPREPIDANKLEQMAKERPNECFLKGSGVLKLTDAIRQLEAELRTVRAAKPEAQPIAVTTPAQLDCLSQGLPATIWPTDKRTEYCAVNVYAEISDNGKK